MHTVRPIDVGTNYVNGVKTTVRRWIVFDGDRRIAECHTYQSAYRIADALNDRTPTVFGTWEFASDVDRAELDSLVENLIEARKLRACTHCDKLSLPEGEWIDEDTCVCPECSAKWHERNTT